MIIINQNYGQLGNQLFLYAHFLAFAAEHGRKVYYPGFAENTPFFPEFQKNGTASIRKNLVGCELPLKANNQMFRLLRRFFHHNSKSIRLVESVSGIKIHFQIDPLKEFAYTDLQPYKKLPTGFFFFEGWAFRVHQTFQKHHGEIRSLFRFSDSLIEACRQTLETAPSKIKVGVHIRMGDYKKLAPQWVYPKDFWYEAMKKIRRECDGSASFFVVSDDNEIDFDEQWIVRHRGTCHSDMALLSECDYILGPPSTFNRWAAFVGGKPHYCAWNHSEFPSLKNFHIFKLSSDSFFELTNNDKEAIRWFGIA